MRAIRLFTQVRVQIFFLNKAYQFGLEGSDSDSPITAALDSISESEDDRLASVV